MGLKYQPWHYLTPAQLFAPHTPLATLHAHLVYQIDQSTSPPLDFQQHLLVWVKQHRHDSSETFNHAVILLGNCPDIRTDAIPMLCGLLKHPEFFIRGNAAVSLAKLKIDQPKLISQIGQLVFDHAGNGDWTTSSAALNALVDLQQHAHHALPHLIAFIEQYPQKPDSRYPCSNRSLVRIFGQILSPHPKVIAWLLNLIEQQEREYATPHSSKLAICVLTKMVDALSAGQLKCIQSFLNSDMLDLCPDDDDFFDVLSAVYQLFRDQPERIEQWIEAMNLLDQSKNIDDDLFL